MREIIRYYYDMDINDIDDYKNYSTFIWNNDTYYFAYFYRDEEELNDLLNICMELKLRNFKVHDIILNKFNSYITKVGDTFYILLKLNTYYNDNIDFLDMINNISKLKLNNTNSKLYRNNWGYLWSKKIDYFEYQISKIGKNKEVVLNSFSYYVGLAENAISYVNKINRVLKISDKDNIVLSHRRIYYPNKCLNYYNPTSFIFDLEVRDVAEALKSEFFGCFDALEDLRLYLKMHKLTQYSYNMLYARLIYPSYYFDKYDLVMNDELDEEELIKIIEKNKEYEEFLNNAYFEISKYSYIERVDWLIKER